MAVRVELDIFSGKPNPAWELGKSETVELESRVRGALPTLGMVEIPALGYRGFVIHGPERHRVYRGQLLRKCPGQGGREEAIATVGFELEFWLLEQGKRDLDPEVCKAVRGALQ